MQSGSSRSPFQEGFAVLREEPLLVTAELTWRWAFGLAAWLLTLGAAAFFLDSVRVSDLDLLLLGSLQPTLERTALIHVFHGTLLRAVWMKFFVLAGLTAMWAFAAATGRAAILRNLVALCGGEDHDEEAGWQFRPMLQLHFLRALWTWIALGCFAASFLLGNAMLQNGRAARVFCIRDQLNSRDAIRQAVDFCSRQGGRLFGLSLAFLALRLVWAGSMFFLVLAPTSLAKHIAVGWVLVMMLALFLVYFAGADVLHLARLAAYVALTDIDAEPTVTPTSTEPEYYPGLPLPDGFEGRAG